MMEAESETGLRRTIRTPQATAMVAGIIIGASIFIQPSEITGQVRSIPGVFLVWLASGLLTFSGALVCSEWAAVLPRTGGVYVFLKEAYGRPAGFLWGWAMFWTMHSGIIAAVAVIFARYAGAFVPLDDAGTKAVAAGAILAISAVNCSGVRQGSTLQTAFTAGKILAIGLIIAAGFWLGSKIPVHFSAGSFTGSGITVRGFFEALVAGLFAFGGWHMVTYNSEETVRPERTIPLALTLGIGIVTVAYVALNAVYLYVLPLDRVAASTRIAADAADAVVGSGGGAFLSAIVLFSTFGGLAGIILCGPRVYYAMAKDGLLFSWLGSVHPRFQTTHLAIILQAVWSSALVVTGTYRVLFTRVVFTEWIFFGLLALGHLRLRARKRENGGGGRSRRMVRGPWVPVLFALACLAIVVHQIASNPGPSAIGLGLVLTGLPAYYLRTKFAKKEPTADDRRLP
jgi:APA family basic amino acid/polyamine antiporter